MQLIDNKKYLKRNKLEEVIDICLFNELEYIEQILKEWLSDEENSLNNYREKIVELGSFCKGIVYQEEYSYELAGFILKRERLFSGNKSIDYLFVPVYIESNTEIPKESPFIFDNCCCIYDDQGFVNDSQGNMIYLNEIILSRDKVNKYIKLKKIDLNKALKSSRLYLNS